MAPPSAGKSMISNLRALKSKLQNEGNQGEKSRAAEDVEDLLNLETHETPGEKPTTTPGLSLVDQLLDTPGLGASLNPVRPEPQLMQQMMGGVP